MPRESIEEEQISWEEEFNEAEKKWRILENRNPTVLEPNQEMQALAKKTFNHLHFIEKAPATHFETHQAFSFEMVISGDGRAVGIEISGDSDNEQSEQYSFYRSETVIDLLERAEEYAFNRLRELEKKVQSQENIKEKEELEEKARSWRDIRERIEKSQELKKK